MFKENKKFWLSLIAILFLFIFSGYIAEKAIDDPNYFVGLTNRFFTNSFKLNKEPIMGIKQDKVYLSEITTSEGVFTIKLFPKNAPKAVNNYVFLASNNYYIDARISVLGSVGLLVGFSDPTNEKIKYSINNEINWEDLQLSSSVKDALKNKGYSTDPSVISKKFYQKAVGFNAVDYKNKGEYFMILSQDPAKMDQYNGTNVLAGEISSGLDVLIGIYNKLRDDPNNSIMIKSVTITE